MTSKRGFCICVLAFFFCAYQAALASGEPPAPKVVQGTLISPGSPPFHLRAAITERADFNEHIDLELFWASPEKWKRTIRSQDFSQTLIVNGDKVFEDNSDDYFPLGLQTLATAVVDPTPILDAWRSGDQLMTKANGTADESGRVCFGGKKTMCVVSRTGLTETVAAPGHTVTFSDYKAFKGRRLARLIVYQIDHGDSLQARVTELDELKNTDEALFAISSTTAPEKRIHSVIVSQSDLNKVALQPLEVIWPQVLDGKTSGETSYYVSIDRTGQVREILPLSVAVERADDSARRQIMRWKFKPVLEDGVPVQAEAVMNFSFNTRAFGPPDMLKDAEARQLASNIVDPVLPTEVPAGSTCAIRVAVDADGGLIEQIAGDCLPAMYRPCSQALGKWHFSPILEDGKSLPYRAEIMFRAP
jgi:hypothetical protein